MQDYACVLAAIDIYSDYKPIVERGLKVAGTSANVHLLYAVYPQASVEPYGLFLEKDYSQDASEQAQLKMNEIAEQYNILSNRAQVVIGAAADEIHHAAQKLHADLIVIGTHGHGGVKLLLGSTATAVLHGGKMDVLAVKI